MSAFAIEPPRLPLARGAGRSPVARRATPPLGLAARPCKGCGRPIYWVTTQDGKRTPLDRYVDHGSDASGRHVMVSSDDSHWGTCPERARFARTAAP